MSNPEDVRTSDGAGEMAHFKEFKFSSQDLHGSSQTSVTPVPGNQILSSGRSQACAWNADIHASKTLKTHTLKNVPGSGGPHL